MSKIHILCGFENREFEDALIAELKRQGYEPVIHVKFTKLSVKEFIDNNPECNTIILTEKIGNKKYTAEELAQLTDKRDVNVIVVLSSRFIGTDYMKTLYTANITGALFQQGRKGVGPREVANLVLNRRSRKDARVFYGIEGQKLDMGFLDDDTYVEYHDRLTGNGGFILKNYIDICSKMSPQQIADFTRRLPKDELEELAQYEEFYTIMQLLKKFGIDLKIKKPKKVVIGFKVPPQISISEEGNINVSDVSETVEEMKEVKEEVKENLNPNKDITMSDFSVDLSSESDEGVDDIFAMLDGGVTAFAGSAKGVDKKESLPMEEPVVVMEREPEKEISKSEEKIPANDSSLQELEEALKQKERLLEERERRLADSEDSIRAEERKRAREEHEQTVARYRTEMDNREKKYEEDLYNARTDGVKMEVELLKEHEKEMAAMRKKQKALERDLVKRGIYEEEDEEDVYLTTGGNQFSFGFVVLLLLVVVAAAVLWFLKPSFLTMGM